MFKTCWKIEGTRLVQQPDMHYGRCFHTLTAVIVSEGSQQRQKLFAIGGHPDLSGEETGKSLEVFDVNTEAWTLRKSLDATRCSHSSVAFSDSLFVIGGNKNRRDTDEIEMYAIGSDTWTTLIVSLPERMYN